MIQNSEKINFKICVVTSPRPKAGIVPLSNLIDILSSISSNLYLITGNEGRKVLDKLDNSEKIHGYCIDYKVKSHLIFKILSYIFLQLNISLKLINLSQKVDIFVFFMGEGLLLPVIVSKLLKKPNILCLAASSSKMADFSHTNHLILQVPKFLELFNYCVCDFIIVYSSKLIEEWNLSKYIKKIYIAQKHFLNFNLFNIKKEIDERPNTIGYIGRLSDEKGAANFIQAIPIILSKINNVKLFIGGDGPLKDKLLEEIVKTEINQNVCMKGWISHSELPKYLNELKLLVIPSYTEGLPNIMLEAMACGTPVLSTSVGAISDVIIDNVTGFIMESNSPDCIAKNVVRALNHPYLSDISKNAYNHVTQTFTYEMAKERYYHVFKEIAFKIK